MKPTIQIRKAELADLEAITAIHNDAITSTTATFVTAIGSANSYKDVLENPDTISRRVLERGLDARSQTRWVTEQNSDTKQPRRGQRTRVAVRGSTEEEAGWAGKASARNFCLDRNL